MNTQDLALNLIEKLLHSRPFTLELNEKETKDLHEIAIETENFNEFVPWLCQATMQKSLNIEINDSVADILYHILASHLN